MTIAVNVVFITGDIDQTSVHLIEMNMRRDNISIMRHSSPHGFDPYNNLNNLNARTIIKDIDSISDVYESFWNGVYKMFDESWIIRHNYVYTNENMFTSFIVELLFFRNWFIIPK